MLNSKSNNNKVYQKTATHNKLLLILHVPHSSLKLPTRFYSHCVLNKKEICTFNKQMCDLYTDKLFSCNLFKHIKAKYSRIYCDVERYEDDNKECMSKFGMGVIYTHTHRGKLFAKVENEYKEFILNRYYRPYHEKLNKIVLKYLKKDYQILFLDCHSFAKEIVIQQKEMFYPDICIGINNDINDNYAALKIRHYFESKNYSVLINQPYAGSLVPNNIPLEYANKVNSVMIEINRELYLSGTKKSKNFSKLKKEILQLFKMLK